MITGKEKLEVLNKAESQDFPISYFFETNQTKLIVHYSDKPLYALERAIIECDKREVTQ